MKMKRKERGKEKKQRGDYLPFPWSLNLNKESGFRLFGRNIISSVFCTFKGNLFVLSQYEKFDRSLFNCLAKTSKDLFDCIMLVSSAK